MKRIAKARIARGETLSVTDGEGTTIHINDGCVWITEHGSFIDHILEKGQRYTFDRPGLAVVTAQTNARVTLLAPRFGAWPARIATARETLYVRSLWQSIVASVTSLRLRRVHATVP